MNDGEVGLYRYGSNINTKKNDWTMISFREPTIIAVPVLFFPIPTIGKRVVEIMTSAQISGIATGKSPMKPQRIREQVGDESL